MLNMDLVSNPLQIKIEVELESNLSEIMMEKMDREEENKKGLIKNEDEKTMTKRIKCADCEQDFFNKSTLKMHIRTVHLKEQRFSCDDCEYKTNNNESLAKHLRSHTGEKPFACAECGKMWTSRSSLSVHIRSIHLKEKRYSCEVCDYKTYQRTRMDEHAATHTGGAKKSNECGKCSEVFNNKAQLSNHMVTDHKFKCCDICGKSFLRQLNLTRHHLKHTSEKRPQKCLDDLDQEDSRIRPQKTYTPEFKVDAVKKVQEIGLMKAARELNLSDSTLKKWRNIILRPSQCSLCGKEFSEHCDLKVHMQRYHPDDCETSQKPKNRKKEHQCDKCSQLLMTKVTLKRHMTKCTGQKEQNEKSTDQLNCNICGKSFKEKRHMKEHIKCVHEKIIDHTCEICSKGFGRKKHLLSHIKTVHEKSGNFECAFCHKKFVQLSVKRRHERKHTGEKPYRCENCGESCSKYKAKQAEYLCKHCKVALVPVVFKQIEPVEPNDTDLKKGIKRRNKVKKQINLPTTSKSQINFSNLRELYRNKYDENADDIPDEESKSISGELVEEEMRDLTNAAVAVNQVYKTVQESDGEEMNDDGNNTLGHNKEEIMGDVHHKVQNGQISNDEELFDELIFVNLIKEQNTEVDDDDCLYQASADSSNIEMSEHNQLPEGIDKNVSTLHENIAEQETESKVEELDSFKIQKLLKSSSLSEDTEVEVNELSEKEKTAFLRNANDEFTVMSEELEIKSKVDELNRSVILDQIEMFDSIEEEIKSENMENMIEECSIKELDIAQHLECEICQKKFLTPRNKREHLKWVHTEEKKLCCEFCSKMFAKQSRLAAHVRCVHEKKEFSCNFCDKVFAQESLKKRHLKLHTGERPYLCQTCGHWFSHKSDMTEHRSKHSDLQDFQCVECLKPFPSRDSLCNHVYKYHRVLPEFPCSICGKQFKKKDVLQRHEEFHMGIRDVDVENQDVFTCPICEKDFKYRTNLTTHMKLHSEEKVPCFVCGKQYTSARGLKEHIALKHERISKFKCRICGKAFARANHLEVHIATHLKPIKCEVCSQGYQTETSLMRHMEKEHSEYYRS